MTSPEWLKPGLYGAAVGGIALAIVGFAWGGWVTGAAAKELAMAKDAEVDYAEFRDPETLEPVLDELKGPVLLAMAVFFPVPGAAGPDRVRLIDNRVLPAGAARIPSNAKSNTRSTK